MLKVDDPCGAISVHGFCGWFGAVCVGIFADGTYGAGWNGVGATTYLGMAGQGVTGLLYGDYRNSGCSWAAPPCAVSVLGLTFRRSSLLTPSCRCESAAETETEGLDIPRFGMTAYPEDALAEAK